MQFSVTHIKQKIREDFIFSAMYISSQTPAEGDPGGEEIRQKGVRSPENDLTAQQGAPINPFLTCTGPQHSGRELSQVGGWMKTKPLVWQASHLPLSQDRGPLRRWEQTVQQKQPDSFPNLGSHYCEHRRPNFPAGSCISKLSLGTCFDHRQEMVRLG